MIKRVNIACQRVFKSLPDELDGLQCFPYIDLFVAPATISKLTATNRFFQKALTSLNKHKHCTFQNRNPVRVSLYHCISEGNRLSSENFGCYFNFILHVMSDKAAFVSGALICVQRYRGNLALSNSASCWQRINLHICRHK